MQDDELNKLLKLYQAPAPDREKKRAAMELAMSARKEIRAVKRIPLWKRLLNMAGYISAMVWAGQAAVLLLGAFFLLTEGYNGTALISMAGPALGCISCLEVQRSYSYGMWEMEQACRYNASQVCMMKIQITSGVDIAVLILLTVIGVSRDIGLAGCMVRILVPYFVTSGVYFWILCRSDRKIANYLMAGAGILMTFIAVFLMESQHGMLMWEILEEKKEWAALMLLLSVDFMLLSMRRFRRKCDGKGKKAWNLS